MRTLLPLLLCLSLSPSTRATPPDPTPAAADTPLTALPYTPGLDLSAMDPSADACTDFYQYACGGWQARNPIPADQERWSVYGKLYQENQRFLWGILDGLARHTEGRSAAQQQIGDYFAACMDADTVEKRAAQPLQPWFAAIAALQAKNELPALLARLHAALGGDGFYFGFDAGQDFADSTRVIAFAEAGGLGLPDRDYYSKDDAHSRSLRAQYRAHVERMFRLLGDAPDAARQAADQVMTIETALAKASLTRVQRRDPHALFHKLDAAGLRALTPHFDWSVYLQAIGLHDLDTFNVTEPAFYQALDAHWQATDLGAIRNYLRWQVAHANAEFLSSAFVDEDFAFFGKTLRGVPQLKPRWKRCVALVDEQLGEALGKEFVERAFSPELKEKTLRMTRQIEQAMQDDIETLTWMSDATKARALEKLHAIVNKIGYPDTWRDYSSIAISRDDFAGNVERASRFETQRQLAKIGKPLDRGEWGMTPPTVNAYFDPQMNDINFPAGVLQPPLFDPRMDDAPGYGNTGGTIGHELTHGFDDEGRQFDAHGNLADWWTPEDARRFGERAQCIVDQYAQYTVVDDIKINSQLTQGEDIADLGGLMLALVAWKAQTAGQAPENRDGLTPEQRFFIGYAQWACENNRPENLRVDAITNPHSPGKYRVNGLMVNMPEFKAAFMCKAGQPMVSDNPCRVW